MVLGLIIGAVIVGFLIVAYVVEVKDTPDPTPSPTPEPPAPTPEPPAPTPPVPDPPVPPVPPAPPTPPEPPAPPVPPAPPTPPEPPVPPAPPAPPEPPTPTPAPPAPPAPPTPTPEPPAPTPTPTPVPTPPAPPEATVYWINNSQANGILTLTEDQASKIVEALNLQVPDLLAAWPSVPKFTNVLAQAKDVPAGAVKAYFLANADVAGALGYHDVDPQGDPYIRVFVETVLQNSGSALQGSLSVAVCASHEMCEWAVDPQCQATATSSNGTSWALETADPVESDAYNVTLSDGTLVSVSDFVYPSFFEVSGQAPYDKLGVLHGPFTIAPGGYAIENNQQVFGDYYPDWRKDKSFPAARTYRRTHGGA